MIGDNMSADVSGTFRIYAHSTVRSISDSSHPVFQ